MVQPFGIDGRDEGVKQAEVFRPDGMVGGVATYGLIGDGGFATQGAVLAIVAEYFKGTPVEIVPRLVGEFAVIVGFTNVGDFVRKFCSQS